MQVRQNVDLSSHNTLQLRCEAELFVEIQSEQDILTLINNTDLKRVSWHILGGGSNLVMPAKIGGLVIKISNTGRTLVKETPDAWLIQAQAGEVWNDFVQWTLQQGYYGLENLSLIPGTVGAAPIQNIGAYGVEVKDSIDSVTCFDLQTGQKKVFNNQECRFSYRDSFFKQEGAGRYLVWEIAFRLPKNTTLHLEYGDIRKELDRQGLTADPRNISKAVVQIRQSKLPDPKVIGNAGSFFKNPVVSNTVRDQLLNQFPDLVSFPYGKDQFKLAAGWLIDRAGWKGKTLGPVGMYEKQALVLVNHGGATAEDVWALAKTVVADVKTKFGVEIEPEPIRW